MVSYAILRYSSSKLVLQFIAKFKEALKRNNKSGETDSLLFENSTVTDLVTIGSVSEQKTKAKVHF